MDKPNANSPLWQQLQQLAQRYQVSADAVWVLFKALQRGNGSMAQFNHPELGGNGQWASSGMLMLSDMFNQALKKTVDGLAKELSSLLREQPEIFKTEEADVTVTPEPEAAPHSQTQPAAAWWPDGLGQPSSTGSQNQTHYAIFPQQRRLAIWDQGRVTIYNTLEHQINGVAQQQGREHSLSLRSPKGEVRLESLPVVLDESGLTQAHAPQQSQQAQTAASDSDSEQVLVLLEKLAALKEKGILTDEEFAQKKTDLLARL